MTAEQWLWIIGILFALLCFWLRDWKERIEEALSVKQKKIDKQQEEITVLKVEVAQCVKHGELDNLRKELSGEMSEGFARIVAILRPPS